MIRPTLTLLSLCAAAAAQVPFDHALVLEDGFFAPDVAFRFVDTLPGGGVTTLRDQRVFTPMTAVAVDPADGGTVFFGCSATSLGGVWRKTVVHESEVSNTWGPWPRVGVAALRVTGGELVYAATTGGLFAAPSSGGAARTLIPALGYRDIATDARSCFALGVAGAIDEVDLASGAVRTVANIPGASCVGIADAFHLVVGSVAGDVSWVDRRTGAVTATVATGKGVLRRIAQPALGLPIVATSNELWSLLDLATPVYRTARTIVDFDLGRTDGASAQRFGDGCGGAGRVPAQDVPSLPTLGNAAFVASASGGPPAASASLLVGASRTHSNALNLPLPLELSALGLSGCALRVDPQIVGGAVFDARGGARVALPVPATPTLRGQRLYSQWIALDPGAPGGAALSDGVAWLLR